MLNEEHSDHQRGTGAHHTDVKKPEMPVADRLAYQKPAGKKDRSIGNGVIDLTSCVKKA